MRLAKCDGKSTHGIMGNSMPKATKTHVMIV